MTLIEIEDQISGILSEKKGEVNSEIYKGWEDLFYKTKNDSNITEEEKRRRYYIVTTAIDSYLEAKHLNSPLTILKDTLGESIKDIKKLPANVFKRFGIPLILVIGVSLGIALVVYKKLK